MIRSNQNQKNSQGASKTVQMASRPNQNDEKPVGKEDDLSAAIDRIRKVRSELDNMSNKMNEIKSTYNEIAEEERKIIDKVKLEINAICDKYGFFCGVILTHQDILGIMQTALSHKSETIEIPYHLFVKSDQK